MSLSAQALTYRIGDCRLLSAVDFLLNPGEIVALVGANGAGKSTLLNVLAGCPKSHGGQVFLEDRPLGEWPWDEIARRRSMLTQSNMLAFNFSVEEVVALGAVPHRAKVLPEQIRMMTGEILARFEMIALRERGYASLSGGERQRTQLARIFLQAMLGLMDNPVYVLLDEPLTALDIVHRNQLLRYMHDSVGQGAGIALVTHDLNIALHHADRVVLMRSGSVYCSGSTAEVMTADNLRQIFQVEVTFISTAGRHHILL